MLCERACFQDTVHRDTSKDGMIAVIEVGMRQAVDQTDVFQRHKGEVRRRAMDRA
jgi:hypothetical protein